MPHNSWHNNSEAASDWRLVVLIAILSLIISAPSPVAGAADEPFGSAPAPELRKPVADLNRLPTYFAENRGSSGDTYEWHEVKR